LFEARVKPPDGDTPCVSAISPNATVTGFTGISGWREWLIAIGVRSSTGLLALPALAASASRAVNGELYKASKANSHVKIVAIRAASATPPVCRFAALALACAWDVCACDAIAATKVDDGVVA